MDGYVPSTGLLGHRNDEFQKILCFVKLRDHSKEME